MLQMENNSLHLWTLDLITNYLHVLLKLHFKTRYELSLLGNQPTQQKQYGRHHQHSSVIDLPAWHCITSLIGYSSLIWTALHWLFTTCYWYWMCYIVSVFYKNSYKCSGMYILTLVTWPNQYGRHQQQQSAVLDTSKLLLCYITKG